MPAATIAPEARSPQLEYYHRNKEKRKKDGTYWESRRKAQKKYRETPRGLEVSALAARRQARSLRTEVVEFLGGKCVGTNPPHIEGDPFITDPHCLQIDHIDGGGFQDRKKKGNRGLLRDVLKNPQKYQLLCANHNWKKRALNQETTPLKYDNSEDIQD